MIVRGARLAEENSAEYTQVIAEKFWLIGASITISLSLTIGSKDLKTNAEHEQVVMTTPKTKLTSGIKQTDDLRDGRFNKYLRADCDSNHKTISCRKRLKMKGITWKKSDSKINRLA